MPLFRILLRLVWLFQVHRNVVARGLRPSAEGPLQGDCSQGAASQGLHIA